jgi:4-amino-4-deoxy-L-arabinose transferase-like glycosyltransferase
MLHSQMPLASESQGYTPQGADVRERCYLAGIVLLALVVRIAVAVFTESWLFPNRHHFWAFGFEMGRIGAAIASGAGFASPFRDFSSGPTAWMPPVYPFIIGAVFKLFGSYSPVSAMVLEGLQIVLSLVNCVLLYAVGKRLFGGPVGLLAAFMLAVYPPGLHYTVQKIWSTDLFVCGLLVVLLQCFTFGARPSCKHSVLTGVSLGVTSLVDPISCALWPFALIWVLCRGQAAWKTRIVTAAVAIVVCCGTIAPWLVRNYLVLGHFVFIKSNFAHTLIAANAPKAWRVGTNSPPPEQAPPRGLDSATTPQADAQTFHSAVPLQTGTLAQHEGQSSQDHAVNALDFILSAPGTYLQKTARRFSRYWLLTKTPDKRGSSIATLSYLALLVVGGIGVCWSLRQGREVQLLHLALFALPIPYYLTVVRLLHYRYPVEVFLLVFGSYALYRISGLILSPTRPWHSVVPQDKGRQASPAEE